MATDNLYRFLQPGAQISEYLNKPGGKLQKELARIGVEVVLDMVCIWFQWFTRAVMLCILSL